MEMTYAQVEVKQRKNQAVLIRHNWPDRSHLCAIPEDELIADGSQFKVSTMILEMAIELGIPWEQDLPTEICVSGDKLGKCLRDNGILSWQDVENDPKGVMSAVQSALGLTFQFIVSVSKAYKEKSNG